MRTIERRAGGRIVAGVAGGVADHLGVDELHVRLVFTVLSALGGAGVVAYGLLWVFTSVGTDTEPASATDKRNAYVLVGTGIAASLIFGALLGGTSWAFLGPLLVVLVGAAVVWREFDGHPDVPRGGARVAWLRIASGTTLVVIGLAVVLFSNVDLSSVRASLLATAVTVLGIGLLTVPLWIRLWRALEAERAARIRTAEREDIASHLHDSVLQTLALIQKQANSPTEVSRLARGQERELRQWLFGRSGGGDASLARALVTLAADVEDHYCVTVDPVTVGDTDLDEELTAVLGATREALVNAAKHSGVTSVDVYCEVEDDGVSVFVRDRGVGFDVDSVPEDRAGLAKSIRARIERRGGEVSVRSTPGRGTEIEIRMPRKVNAA